MIHTMFSGVVFPRTVQKCLSSIVDIFRNAYSLLPFWILIHHFSTWLTSWLQLSLGYFWLKSLNFLPNWRCGFSCRENIRSLSTIMFLCICHICQCSRWSKWTVKMDGRLMTVQVIGSLNIVTTNGSFLAILQSQDPVTVQSKSMQNVGELSYTVKGFKYLTKFHWNHSEQLKSGRIL